MSNKSEEELNAMAEDDIKISNEYPTDDFTGEKLNQGNEDNTDHEIKTRNTTKSILYDLIFYAILIVICVYVL
ncbi:MAG: hypothetical protein K0S04_3121, partial [Herbinix sp.]|nr:hypothetical protein [Herbinix sp.]